MIVMQQISFHIFFKFIFLCFISVWNIQQLGAAENAKPWRIVGSEIPVAIEESLRLKYPTLASAHDIQNLLEELGLKVPAETIEAHAGPNEIEIKIVGAKIISGITLRFLTRDLRARLDEKMQNYIGQVDSQSIETQLQKEMLKILADSGYPSAKVQLNKTVRESTEIEAFFDIQDPCTIEGIEFNFSVPEKFRKGLRIHEVCDLQDLIPKITQLEDAMRKDGFNQARVEFDRFKFPKESVSKATVVLKGNLGIKIKYEIIDPTRRFLIDDLFSSNELSKIDPSIVGPEAMISELTQKYRARSFLDVVVTGPEVKNKSEDEKVYSYKVEAGTSYVLNNVKIEGETFYKEEELLQKIGFGKYWVAQGPINIEEIKKGIESAKNDYLKAGFWDIEILDRSPAKDRERGIVQLTISVREGSRRLLRSTQYSGQKFLLQGELEKMMTIEQGSGIDRSVVLEIQQNIRSELIKNGFFYSEVQIKFTETPGKFLTYTDIIFTIHENERVKIGDISIIGLSFTQTKIVKREILFHPGDWYDPHVIADTRRALLKLGFFKTVQIFPADSNALSEKKNTIDLIVDVREGMTKNISFGPGWSTFYGLRYGVESSYTNILGTGRQLYGRASISEEQQQSAIDNKTLVGRSVGVGYLEPYLFDVPLDGSANITQYARATEETWELSRAGELGVTHKLRVWIPDSEITGFYGKKITRSEGDPERFDALLADNYNSGRLGLRFNLDRRNDITWPTRGFSLNSEVSWARYFFSGDLEYMKFDILNNYYFDLGHSFSLAFSLGLTSYENIHRENQEQGDVLPYSERLQAGGADTVRGYRERTLGPIVNRPTLDLKKNWDCGSEDANSGGNRRTVLKFEVRYRATDNIGLTGFVDSGNAFFSREEERKFETAFKDDAAINNPQIQKTCGSSPRRTLRDNNSYEYKEVFRDTKVLWDKHYYSYGIAGNAITPIGAINLAYGLPWKEPRSRECDADEALCKKRGHETNFWLLDGELHFNIGAKF